MHWKQKAGRKNRFTTSGGPSLPRNISGGGSPTPARPRAPFGKPGDPVPGEGVRRLLGLRVRIQDRLASRCAAGSSGKSASLPFWRALRSRWKDGRCGHRSGARRSPHRTMSRSLARRSLIFWNRTRVFAWVPSIFPRCFSSRASASRSSSGFPPEVLLDLLGHPERSASSDAFGRISPFDFQRPRIAAQRRRTMSSVNLNAPPPSSPNCGSRGR